MMSSAMTAISFGCQPLSGQLELLKLSFFPAVFAAAPGLGALESALEGREEQTSAVTCGEDWAVEYAGVVRNMLCAPHMPKPFLYSTLNFAADITASVRQRPCWPVLGSLTTWSAW